MLSTEIPKTSQPISRNWEQRGGRFIYSAGRRKKKRALALLEAHLVDVIVEGNNFSRAHEGPIQGVPEKHVVLRGGMATW